MHRKDLEQTLVLIKPDALKNSVTGFLLSQLSEYHTGSRFSAAKIVHVNRILAEEHYAEHRGKVFFEPLLDYITGCIHYPTEAWKRRVIAIVYQGPNALKTIRAAAGPTNPHNARDEKPGSLRALGTVVPIKNEAGEIIGDRLDNLIHASANHEDAEREVKLWFMPRDIPHLMRAYPTAICEAHFYFKDGELLDHEEEDSVLILAPGEEIWESDLAILESHVQGKPSGSVNTVAAKYLINRNIPALTGQ